MNIEVNLQRTRLGKIGLFDAENPGAFPAAGMQRDNLNRVAAIATRLDELVVSQTTAHTGSMGGTQRKNNALGAIKEDLTDLSQASLALEDEIPGVRADFALPTQNRDQLWIDLADAVPGKLTPHLPIFIEAGLESDFLTDLAADVALYNAADDAQESDDASGGGDTQEISKLISEAVVLIKKLDVFAQIRFKKATTEPWLARWDIASKLGDPRRAHRKTDESKATA